MPRRNAAECGLSALRSGPPTSIGEEEVLAGAYGRQRSLVALDAVEQPLDAAGRRRLEQPQVRLRLLVEAARREQVQRVEDLLETVGVGRIGSDEVADALLDQGRVSAPTPPPRRG